MVLAPVLLMAMASHPLLLVVLQSLLWNVTLSQSMVWLFFMVLPVIAEGCTRETESFLASCELYILKDLTSCWSPFSLTSYFLSISSVYIQRHSLQGAWYTNPAFSCGVLLSLGCTSILWRVKWGFMAVDTPWWWTLGSGLLKHLWCMELSLLCWWPCHYPLLLSYSLLLSHVHALPHSPGWPLGVPTPSRSLISVSVVHPSAITNHVTKKNHTIDLERVKFPRRDCDTTKRGASEAITIKRTWAHAMNHNGKAPPTSTVLHQAAAMWCQRAALMMVPAH